MEVVRHWRDNKRRIQRLTGSICNRCGDASFTDNQAINHRCERGVDNKIIYQAPNTIKNIVIPTEDSNK